MPCGHFRRVDDIVAREGVDGDHRQRAVHQHIVRGSGAVAHIIGDARRHGVIGFTQRAHRRGGDGNAPVAAGVGGGGVVDTVQINGDGGSFRLVAGTGKQQICALLCRIDHVIRGQRVNTDNGRHSIDHHIH